MAKLISGSLIFDVDLRSFRSGRIVYEMRWLLDGKPILNDSIVNRTSERFSAQTPGGIYADEPDQDFFIPLIEGVLKTGKPDFHQTPDPNVTLTIYPGSGFPFLRCSQAVENRESPAEGERREHFAAADREIQPDNFCLMMFLDVQNFKGGAYTDNGLCLTMRLSRQELECFCRELRSEYASFKDKWKVDEYSASLLAGS